MHSYDSLTGNFMCILSLQLSNLTDMFDVLSVLKF